MMLWFGGYQTHSNTDSHVLKRAQESQYFQQSGLLPLLKASGRCSEGFTYMKLWAHQSSVVATIMLPHPVIK